MIITHPIQFGRQRIALVDFGQGINVGVTFISSDLSLFSVAIDGTMTVTADVAETQVAYLYCRDSAGVDRKVFDMQIVPTTFDLSAYLNQDGSMKDIVSNHITPPSTLVNLVPAMTDYNLPSGVVSASSEANLNDSIVANRYYAWHAFDHASLAALGPSDNDAPYTWGANGAYFPQWIAYQFPTGVKAHAYAITARSNATYVDMTPSYWTFEGSNDGTNWTVLDTRNAQFGWVAKERREFSIPNAVNFLHYRLNITNNNGSTLDTNLAELEILG